MLGACVSYPDYPLSWVPIDYSKGDCAHIAGIYKNHGVWIHSRSVQGSGTLITRLFQSTSDELAGVVHVAIDLSTEGRLDITAQYEDHSSAARTYFTNQNEYSCNNGAIEIPYSINEVIGYGLVMGLAQGTITLAKTQTGDLVLKDSAAGAGFILLLPIPIAGQEWLLFQPL